MTTATSRRSQSRFRERAELLDFMLDVAVATSETLDLDELLQNVSNIVRRVLHYELFAILLYNEREKDLRIRYAVGHREEIVRNLSIPLGEGITGVAALKREAILVKDVRKDERYLSAIDAVRTELAVPMLTRGRLVGVIDVQSTSLGAYQEEDRSMLRLIASRVATSIDNARLYRRAERQNRTLKTLRKISNEISSILELDELLNTIAASVRSLMSYDAFSILLVDEEQKALRHRFSIRYDQRVNTDNVPLGKGITGTAAELKRAVRVHDTISDERYIASHADIRSEIAVPLMLHDKVIGVLDVESDQLGFFTEDHERTLVLLAPQVAASIENAQLYQDIAQRERHMQEDLSAAHELQTILMPTEAPEVHGMEVAIGFRPARLVSGDIFDFFEHRDEQTAIAFGDSSGKGAAAALYGAVVSGLMRTLARRHRHPAQLMKALNARLIERKVEARYVTLLLLLWDPHSRVLTMSNAGATLPVIFREKKMIDLKLEGVPIGLLPDREYDEVAFKTQSGDLIVLYSDGVSDHLSPEGKEYGRGRLVRVLRRRCWLKPDDVVKAVFADLDKYNTTLFDDQTLIVMKVK
ncbi:MAG TPA: SpoIIE family protein phosphatase [Bryobacteraceae bacterium]|jgi:sigma-B regulation protein RsbU (phosphoserine phosphatase)